MPIAGYSWPRHPRFRRNQRFRNSDEIPSVPTLGGTPGVRANGTSALCFSGGKQRRPTPLEDRPIEQADGDRIRFPAPSFLGGLSEAKPQIAGPCWTIPPNALTILPICFFGGRIVARRKGLSAFSLRFPFRPFRHFANLPHDVGLPAFCHIPILPGFVMSSVRWPAGPTTGRTSYHRWRAGSPPAGHRRHRRVPRGPG